MLKWLDRRLFISSLFTQVMIPRGKASWQYFPAFFTFILLLSGLFTGAILAFLYNPQNVGKVAKMYPFIYNCHAITAHLTIVFVVLYLLRNLFTGTYRSPREVHWLTLITLFALIWINYCVGAVLPTDELQTKPLETFTNTLNKLPLFGMKIIHALDLQQGMTEVARHRLFVLHCFILPMITNFVILFYFWLLLAPKIFRKTLEQE